MALDSFAGVGESMPLVAAIVPTDASQPGLAPASSSEMHALEVNTIAEETSSLHAGESITPESPGTTAAVAQRRLEALLEQQNLLILRQVQMAEATHKEAQATMIRNKSPREFLQTVNPRVRGIFKAWHAEFSSKISLYISQRRLSAKYLAAAEAGELTKPFLDDAQRSWDWPQFYRLVAKPIEGIELPSAPHDVPLSMADDGAKSEGGPCLNSYDVEATFAEMQRKHAWELQNFVTAHQKVCLEKLVEELALSTQVRNLQAKLAVSANESSSLNHMESNLHLDLQAKNFVELVHRDQMLKAEDKMKECKDPHAMFIAMMRAICIITLLFAITNMSHELLTRLFAILFALGCGMALVWEDLVVSTLRIVLGETTRRLRFFSPAPQQMTDHFPDCVNIWLPIAQ